MKTYNLQKKKNTIHLQYVGDVPAQESKNIKIGTKLMWNGGSIYEVTSVAFSKTGKTMIIKERYAGKSDSYHDSNKEYERRLNVNRLVAIV